MSNYTNTPRKSEVKSRMRESNLEFDRVRLLSSVDLISDRCSNGVMAGRIMEQMDKIADKITDRESLTRGERDMINMLTRMIVS